MSVQLTICLLASGCSMIGAEIVKGVMTRPTMTGKSEGCMVKGRQDIICEASRRRIESNLMVRGVLGGC